MKQVSNVNYYIKWAFPQKELNYEHAWFRLYKFNIPIFFLIELKVVKLTFLIKQTKETL